MQSGPELARLSPSTLESFYKLLPFEILGQAYIQQEDLQNFRCYIFQNTSGQKTLLIQPICINASDEPTASCGIRAVLDILTRSLLELKCQQILIPIAEVGGYPIIPRPSRHFILHKIDCDATGTPISSITLDSNHYAHLRKNRETDLTAIMRAWFLSDKIYQGRKNLGWQSYGDNTACGYFVFYFIQEFINNPGLILNYDQEALDKVFLMLHAKLQACESLEHDPSYGVFAKDKFDIKGKHLLEKAAVKFHYREVKELSCLETSFRKTLLELLIPSFTILCLDDESDDVEQELNNPKESFCVLHSKSKSEKSKPGKEEVEAKSKENPAIAKF